MTRFFGVLLFLFSASTQAEYRVYRLGVKYTVDAKEKESEILTTLDNLQYETYYKLTATQQTRLIEHWMCRGRTDGFKKYCSKPLPLTSQAQGLNAAPPPQQPTTPVIQ